MYRVIAYNGIGDRQGAVLHEPESYGNKAISGTVNLLFNGVNTAEFEIPMSNSLFRQIQPITWLIKVVNTLDGDVVFDGRVAKVDGEFSGLHSQTIKCEDCLAYLHDSTQVYRKVQNTTIREFLQMIVDEHNKQVESWKRFRLGEVTVTNSTDNVYRYTSDTQDTFDTIKDKLIDRMGGYLIWHRDGNDLVLDYLKDYGQHVDTPIMVGKNLKSAKREFDVTELITRLVPVGSAIEQPEGATVEQGKDAAQPKYTIESVNNGVRYLEDVALQQRFGIIQKAVEWQDVKVPQILKSKGQEYLSAQRVGLLSWTVDVVDISLLDSAYRSFQLGNYYPIVDDFLSVREDLQVVEKKLDITQPQKMTLKVGTQNKTLSQYQLEYKAAMTYIEEQRQNSLQTLAAMKQQLATLKAISDKLPAQEAQIKELERRIAELEASGGSSGSGGGGGTYSGNIIDVSEWQTTIDWSKVIGAGLALAIIRVQHGSTHEDLTYKVNIPAVIKAGANYAVYAYFSATSTADAAVEANDFYNRARAVIGSGRQPRFWAIDVETVEMGGNVGAMRAGVEAYMDKLNALGVPDSKIVLYIANHLYPQFNLNVNRAAAVWIPSYGANDGTVAGSTKPAHPYDLWQYTSTGSVPGIKGNVDMNTDPSERFKQQFLSK